MDKRILSDEELLGIIKKNAGGGGGGTSDYSQLTNKPQINGNTLTGNKSASDLSLASTADLAEKVDKVEGKVLSTNDYTDEDKAIVGGVTEALAGKQNVLTAGANINMAGNVVKAGVVEVVEPDMTVYGNSTESGSKTYTIETTGVYEIFYCLSLRSTVSVTLPNDANVLFENDLTVSSHPVKHIVAELHEGDTVTIAQTPSQWNAVVSGVLKLDAISVINVAHTGSIADNTITYTLPNDNKYYLVVGACVGNPTGNNAVDSTSGGTPEITRTLTGSGVRFRSVVVKGSDSPSFSFYGYDGGVASIIAYEIEFEEGNWDYNLATKNYVDTAIDAAVSSAYHHAGTKTCAELVAGLLVAGNEGNVYNVTDSGTTTADFIEGAGQPIKAGDNVGIAKISDGVYKFDLLSGFVDTTNFVQKSVTAGLIKNDGTVDTTIQGDIGTLKSGFTNLDNEVNGDATVYPYADVITIEDAVPANVADCTVKIEPVQDLHGQSAPYVGGAGKNKLPMTVDGIKALNTSGTWSGNTYTINNVGIEVLTDADGNVTGIKANGTASQLIEFKLCSPTVFGGNEMILNGCPAGGSAAAFNIQMYNATTSEYLGYDTGSGYTYTYTDGNEYFAEIVVRKDAILENLPFYPMLRLATETDATFAPYTNICPISGHTEASVTVVDDAENPTVTKTYTIAFGDTIYGGIVRIDSNGNTVMDVDRATVEYDGSEDESWLLDTSGENYFFTIELLNRDLAKVLIANNCENVAIAKGNTNIGVGGDARYLRYRYANDNSLTVSDLKTFLASNNLQICYYIATPTTIQLTPQQIQLLKGTNTLTASTGQISVTVNGVSGAIGAVQEQVNELAEDVVDIATAVATKADYRKYAISVNASSYTISDLSDIFMSIMAVSIPTGYSDPVNGLYVLCRQGNTLLLTPLQETTSTLGLTATLTDGNIVLAWTATNNYGGTIALIDLYKIQ